MISFHGRVVLITGAGGGLGRSHALYLSALGAKVVVNDFGGTVHGSGQCRSMAEETVTLIEAQGGEAVADDASVETVEGASRMVGTAIARFGRLDAIINNAGILRDVSFRKQTEEDWQKVIDVHLTGSRNVTKAAWNHFCERGYGRIIMTSSASGLYGNFGQTNYAAAKMGVIGLMNALKEEGAKYNIKVNAIAPMARSRMTENLLPPEVLEKLDPRLVSPVVAYLASEGCAVNGQCWAVGAGYVARSAVVEAEGVRFDASKGFGAADVAARLHDITDLSRASDFENLAAVSVKMMS